MHHLKYHYATYCCNDTRYMRLKWKTVNLCPKLYTEKCPTKSPEQQLTFFSHPFESVTVLSKQLRSRLVCIYFSNFVIVLRQTRPLSTSFSSAWIFYNNHADSHNARCEAFHQSQVSLVSYTVINCEAFSLMVDCEILMRFTARYCRLMLVLWSFHLCFDTDGWATDRISGL